MKCCIIVFVLFISTVAADSTNFQVKKSSTSLRKTLHSLRPILNNMGQLMWNLRELKFLNNEINKSKIQFVKKIDENESPCNTKSSVMAMNFNRCSCNEITSNNSDSINRRTTVAVKSNEKKIRPYISATKQVMGMFYFGKTTKQQYYDMWKCSALVKKPRMIYNGTIPKQEGTLLTGCPGKHYLFGATKTITAGMAGYCCMFGMTLATVNNTEDLDCLLTYYRNKRYFKEYKNVKFDWFGTLFADIMLDHNFVNPLDGLSIPEHMWLKNQPNNEQGAQNCGGLKLTKDPSMPSGYDDLEGSIQLYPLCQIDIVDNK